LSQLNEWATELAESAVPYEVDLAPDIVDAYLKGGESREELFQQTDTSIAGGWGPGGAVALLPWILNGVAVAAKWILSLLSSDGTSNAVGVVKDIKELLNQDKNSEARNKIQELPQTEPYEALKQVIDIMRAELKTAGLSDDEADLIAFRVLIALLDNSQGTATFIAQLEAAS
jgi:hypothetical protein